MCFFSEFLKDLLVVLVCVERVVDIGSDEPPLLAVWEKFSLWGNGVFGRGYLIVVDVLASDERTVDVHIII